MRTIETMVTFRHPFVLAALETAQPAGTYRLVTEEEEIPGLSFVAFRRTAMMLHLPALPATGATHQVVSVDPVEWGRRRGGGRPALVEHCSEGAKQRGAVAETRLFQIASFGGKDALHWKTTLIGRHAANTAAN
jgi:hypothetical protein